MSVERKNWRPYFNKSSRILWPCPSCNSKGLKIAEGSLKFMENFRSKEARGNSEWEPEWIEGVFNCFLECGCGEVVAVSGNYSVDVEFDNRGDWTYSDYFTPTFLSPSPVIFAIPTRTPENVAAEIRKAFQLSWLEPSASANRVRSGIELLLNYQKVKRLCRDRSGKVSRINLHQRIEVWQAGEPDLGAQLLAIKWLGNA